MVKHELFFLLHVQIIFKKILLKIINNMSTVNLYDVLNIPNDSTPKLIKDSYRKLVKEFHPDRPSGDAEMFELITHAYNILINTSSRKEYDEIFNLSKQCETVHFDLKGQSSSFLKAQDSDTTNKKSKKEKQNDFVKENETFDRKHGYKREKEILDKLSEKDTSRKLWDLKLAREQDDIENIQEKIFNEKFDISRFNKAYDELHETRNELIKHTGNPDAWNNLINDDTNFTSLENYENLYVEDENLGTTHYSNIKNDTSKKKKLTKEDIEKLEECEYTKNHNFIDEDYSKFLEEKLHEREEDTTKFDDRNLEDFDTDSFGGYGIFDKLGIKNLSTIEWDDDDTVKARYKKLLDLRKSPINK